MLGFMVMHKMIQGSSSLQKGNVGKAPRQRESSMKVATKPYAKLLKKISHK
jgi:hypothetical protein